MALEWYKPRGYLHFDRPVNKAAALVIVSNPDAVSRHAFYPFIRYIAQTQKVFFDKALGKVVKKEPKQRPISYAAHVDSHIYSYYCNLLNNIYEERLLHCDWASSVLAFRKIDGKSNIDFARDAFEKIKLQGDCCVIAIDVKGFFDNLDHAHLKKSWQALLGKQELPDDHYAIFRSLTKYSFVIRDEVYETLGISKSNPRNGRSRICDPQTFRTKVRNAQLIKINFEKKGIPQGSPISAALSNIYMMSFDERVGAYAKSLEGAYYRYCDDVLLVVPQENEIEAINFVEQQVNDVCLEIQRSKTEICRFTRSAGVLTTNRNLQYLGFIFDGKNIYLRSSSLARYQDRVNKGVWLAAKCMEKVNSIRISKGQLPRPIFLKKLYKRYSYLGRRNFISYGYRAAKKMDSESIRKQLKPHWKRLRARISDVQGE